jgi:4-hydroxybenzoate polyprenyltransferase
MRIPALIGMALPPIFGAISTGNFSFSVLVPLFIIGGFSGIYGFVLNDYIDANLDTLSPDLSKRPLVKGTISKKSAKIIIISCFLGAYVAVFLFFYRNHLLFFTGLLCLIVADVLGGIYNIYGKRIIGSDFLLALAQSLYFLFGAFMALTNGSLGTLTWILSILIFNQLLYMNAIAGGLKDADHDYLMQVNNIALACGVKVTEDKRVFIPRCFKAFGIGLRCFSAVLIFVPSLFYKMKYESWQILLLIFLIVLMLYTGILMLSIKRFERNKLRKMISIQLFMWYFIVPVMLLLVIGTLYEAILIVLILIILPLGWYIFFSILIGEKILEPEI